MKDILTAAIVVAFLLGIATLASLVIPEQPTGGNIPAMERLGPEFDDLYKEVDALGYALDLDVYTSPNLAAPYWSASVRIGQDSTGVHVALSADGTTAREAVDALKAAITRRNN